MEQKKIQKTAKGSTKTTTKKSVTNATKQEPKLTDYSFNELVSLANEKYRKAQVVLRKLYTHEDIPDNVMEDLKMAAVLGLAEAQFTLADKLVYKYNNYSEGVLWCMRSAENNCADAQKMMGDIFRSGRHGVNRDMERAFNYYKKAAEGGNTKSCLILAKMYRNGEYVEQNYQEALRYYTRVVMEPDDKKYGSNHWTANQDLAELYLLGLGTTENGAKAAEYCMNNALQGDSGSAYKAGEIFYFGLAGVEKNLPEALRCYEMAATMGCHNPKALLKLAGIFEDGVEVPTNLSLALKYYKKVLTDERLAYDYFGDLFECVFDFVEKKIADIEKRIAEDQTPSES